MATSKRQTNKKGSTGNGVALARVGDPLITETGDKVDPEGYVNGRKKIPAPEPITFDPPTFRALKRRTLADLAGPPNLINGVGAVFMYTILGIGDREIASALKCTVEEVEAVRKHDAYRECFNCVTSELISTNSDLLAGRVAAYANNALETVGTLVMDGKKEETRLRASIDIMDRAGIGAKEIAARNASNAGSELRIVLVSKTKDVGVEMEFGLGDE